MSSDDRRERLAAAGRWLREQREKRGFQTAAEFARRLGVDRAVLSNYERGVNAVDDVRAEQIAEVLGMDLIDVRRGLGLWVPATLSPEHEASVQRVKDLIASVTALMDQIEAKSEGRKARQARAIREMVDSLNEDEGPVPQDRE